MALFLLSVWHDAPVEFDPSVPPDAEMQQMFDRVGRFNRELEDAGAWVFAGGLYPPASASVALPANGDVSFAEGPYHQANEHMGGFWVIDVDDRAAALDWASHGAAACGQPVEVRPFHDS